MTESGYSGNWVDSVISFQCELCQTGASPPAVLYDQSPVIWQHWAIVHLCHLHCGLPGAGGSPGELLVMEIILRGRYKMGIVLSLLLALICCSWLTAQQNWRVNTDQMSGVMIRYSVLRWGPPPLPPEGVRRAESGILVSLLDLTSPLLSSSRLTTSRVVV